MCNGPDRLLWDDLGRWVPPSVPSLLEAALRAEEGNKSALAAKADATCWVIEHLRGQAAYRQQQAKRLTELSRSDASRADALAESLVFVLTRLQPEATRFSFPNHELTSRMSPLPW